MWICSSWKQHSHYCSGSTSCGEHQGSEFFLPNSNDRKDEWIFFFWNKQKMDVQCSLQLTTIVWQFPLVHFLQPRLKHFFHPEPKSGIHGSHQPQKRFHNPINDSDIGSTRQEIFHHGHIPMRRGHHQRGASLIVFPFKNQWIIGQFLCYWFNVQGMPIQRSRFYSWLLHKVRWKYCHFNGSGLLTWHQCSLLICSSSLVRNRSLPVIIRKYTLSIK